MLKPFWSLCQGENVFFDFFKFKNEEKPKTINIFFLSQKQPFVFAYFGVQNKKFQNFEFQNFFFVSVL